MEDGDAEFIARLLNEEPFLRFIGDRGVRNAADARGYIRDGPVASYRLNGFGLLLVQHSETAEPIGICGLVSRDELEHPDIGFAFIETRWSRGYAYESAAAVLAHSREALGIARVEAITLPENTASIRLLQKLGFRYARPVRVGEDTLDLYALEWR